MARQNRKVLLFIDNCCAHPQIHSLRAVTHLFLSLNTTAVIQPCDVGIIKNLKHYYQKMLMRSILTWDDSGKDMNGVPDYLTRCYGHVEGSMGRQSVCWNDSVAVASFNLRLLLEQMKKQQKLKRPKTSGVCESCMSWTQISMLAMWWRSTRSWLRVTSRRRMWRRGTRQKMTWTTAAIRHRGWRQNKLKQLFSSWRSSPCNMTSMIRSSEAWRNS